MMTLKQRLQMAYTHVSAMSGSPDPNLCALATQLVDHELGLLAAETLRHATNEFYEDQRKLKTS